MSSSGPGRGTLAADALRAMRGAGLEPPVELVETSPVLRARAGRAAAAARWHDDLVDPARTTARCWSSPTNSSTRCRSASSTPAGRELTRRPSATAASSATAAGRDARRSPAVARDRRATSPRRLAAQGGAALIVDYGHDRPRRRRHAAGGVAAMPLPIPSRRRASATSPPMSISRRWPTRRAARARASSARSAQGDWLEAMGIELRAAALAKAAPERAEEIDAARDRLTAPDQMGRLFKVMALVAPGWPEPAGFRMSDDRLSRRRARRRRRRWPRSAAQTSSRRSAISTRPRISPPSSSITARRIGAASSPIRAYAVRIAEADGEAVGLCQARPALAAVRAVEGPASSFASSTC